MKKIVLVVLLALVAVGSRPSYECDPNDPWGCGPEGPNPPDCASNPWLCE